MAVPRDPAGLSRRSCLAAFGGLALGGLPGASAQPDPSRPAGPGIADGGSAVYRFERWTVPAGEGRDRMRVTLGVPRRPAPSEGHPAAWLLDGNAALAALDEPLLQALDASGRAPLLVALGPDSALRFDAQGRAYDYTPPALPGEAPPVDPLGRRGGGAEAFLQRIAEAVRPQVAARAALDPDRQLLWGHSYGGLFVLHALFTRPTLFSHYVSADPALWWADGLLLRREAAAVALPAGPARQLLVISGTGDAGRDVDRPSGGAVKPPPPEATDAAGMPAARADRSPEDVERMRRARRAVPATALGDLVKRQAARPNLETRWIRLDGLAHGPLLPVSLGIGLRGFAGLDLRHR